MQKSSNAHIQLRSTMDKMTTFNIVSVHKSKQVAYEDRGDPLYPYDRKAVAGFHNPPGKCCGLDGVLSSVTASRLCEKRGEPLGSCVFWTNQPKTETAP